MGFYCGLPWVIRKVANLACASGGSKTNVFDRPEGRPVLTSRPRQSGSDIERVPESANRQYTSCRPGAVIVSKPYASIGA